MNKTKNTLISALLISSICLGISHSAIPVSEKTSKSLNEIAHTQTIEALPDTTSFKQGTVNCLILNVRKAASTKQSVVTRLKKNDKVTVLETNKNGWSKIKTSKNVTGWVCTKYLKVTTIKVANVTVSNTVNTNVTTNLQITSQSKETQEKNTIINNIIKKEGSVTTKEITTLKNNLNKLPLAILKKADSQKLTVLVTTKDVKSYYKYSFSGTMTGLYDPMVNKVYINHKESYINQSLVHEFGHAFDLMIGKNNYISLSKDWNDIYKAESSTATSSYYRTNAQEYFADAFTRYINDSKTLKTKAPKTYNFIDSAIKNLK